MKLTTALGLLLLVVPVGLLPIFALAPASPLRTLSALGLGVLLVGVLELVLLTRDRRSAPFDLLLVGLICAFFLVRLPVLWLLPDQFLYPGTTIEPGDMVRTLAFLSVGTAVAALGFRLGVGWRPWRRRRRPDQKPPVLRVSMPRLLTIGVLYSAIEAMQWVFAGTTSSALTPDAPGGGLLFLRHFISLYAAVGIGLVAGLDRWPHSSLLVRTLFVAFIALFLAYTLAGGSRGGLVTVTIALYLLIRRGNFRVRPAFVAGIMAATVVSIVLYPAATLIRHAWLAASEAAQGQISADSPLGPTNSWLVAGLLGATNRLNGLDPLLMIVARKEAVPVEEAVNASQTIKSVVNLLVPSVVLGREPFPDVLPSSRLFSAVYRGRSPEFIASWYQTDMWTFWGTAFALGGWMGAPMMMVVVAALLGAGYRCLARRAGAYNVLLRFWWLYGTYLVIISYGFDVDLTAAIYLFVGGLVVVLLVRPQSIRTPVLSRLERVTRRPAETRS
jgi:hypothetical protein